jgi:hypothetical protein
MTQTIKRLSLLLIVVLVLVAATGNSWSNAAQAEKDAKPSVIVYPVGVRPDQLPADMSKRVGIVIATFLERAGLEDLDVADTRFAAPDVEEADALAKAFGKQVAEAKIDSDYAVYVQLVGSPQMGVKAIHTIVVDNSGKVVLAEAADKTALDRAEPRAKDPMSCCIFVARRLQKLWDLEDPLREDAPQGKMARFWQQDAGIPSEQEFRAIEKRAEELKRKIASSTCTVYPVHLGDNFDKGCATQLAKMIQEVTGADVAVSEAIADVKVPRHSNEQKVLWDTARAFQDFVKDNPPDTDYALFADYALAGGKVFYVHAVVCDRSGDWVLVELQNSHHPLFAEIQPQSGQDANRLLVANLRQWLGK